MEYEIKQSRNIRLNDKYLNKVDNSIVKGSFIIRPYYRCLGQGDNKNSVKLELYTTRFDRDPLIIDASLIYFINTISANVIESIKIDDIKFPKSFESKNGYFDNDDEDALIKKIMQKNAKIYLKESPIQRRNGYVFEYMTPLELVRSGDAYFLYFNCFDTNNKDLGYYFIHGKEVKDLNKNIKLFEKIETNKLLQKIKKL